MFLKLLTFYRIYACLYHSRLKFSINNMNEHYAMYEQIVLLELDTNFFMVDNKFHCAISF